MRKTDRSRVPPSVSTSRNRGTALAGARDRCLPRTKRLRLRTRWTFHMVSRAGQIRQMGSASPAPKDGRENNRYPLQRRRRRENPGGNQLNLTSTQSSRLRKKSHGKTLSSIVRETWIRKTSPRPFNAYHVQRSLRPHTPQFV